MSTRLDRFHKIARLAEKPTPWNRLLAAAIAGAIAFGLICLLFWIIWGFLSATLMVASFALAVAAAFAAVTNRLGMSVVYGIVGAIWLLFEVAVAGFFAAIVACFG